MTPAQLERIRAVVLEKAQLHKELRRPLTLAGARRVCMRELVALSFREHPRPAQLIRTPHGWKIIVDVRSSERERVVCIAHELGHLWLHHAADRDEPIVFDRTGETYDAIREAEADHFAELLVGGPATLPKAKPVRRRPRPSDEPVQDPDDAKLLEIARRAQQEYARAHPTVEGPTVQFAIARAMWQSIRFTVGDYPHYTNIHTGANHELVTASVTAAASIVEQLARAGHKRTAVFVRRRVREALQER